MNSRIFALVDCNNFYASCERVFNPKLENEPIVVLSNNDGCIVSRSNEAKELKIPMGAPYFKYKELMNKNGVHVFSSNYTFYGDMSRRVMKSLRMLLPDLEIYSIDEAFVDLSQYRESNLVEIGEEIKEKVKQWTGIPVSIGIAQEVPAIFIGCNSYRGGVLGAINRKGDWQVICTIKICISEYID